jgi:hypothetical protein
VGAVAQIALRRKFCSGGWGRYSPTAQEETPVTFLIPVVVAILTFASGLAGLYLQKLLPEQHSVEKSRDMIGATIGLVTLLLALVLGTIVGSAYYFSSTQQSELQTLSARYLLLDKALAQYGPETKPVRDRLKEALTRNYALIWRGEGDSDPEKLSVGSAMAALKPLEDYLASLDAKTPAQTRAVAAAGANFAVIEQTRMLMSLQLAVPFSRHLLLVVVAWSLFLFCGFGLLSRLTATTLAALAFGAFAVAGQRDVSHSRTQLALYGPVPRFAGGDRADDRRHRQIAVAPRGCAARQRAEVRSRPLPNGKVADRAPRLRRGTFDDEAISSLAWRLRDWLSSASSPAGGL